MAMLLHPDFADFLRSLNDHKVEYLVIGGYAVGFHGYPRTTADLDIWIAINEKNAGRIVQALEDFGFAVPDLSIGLFLEKDKIIRMGKAPVRIEILTTISGVNFKECYRNRKVSHIDDIKVNFIDLKDLKKNKRASGRKKDLDDLENLP